MFDLEKLLCLGVLVPFLDTLVPWHCGGGRSASSFHSHLRERSERGTSGFLVAAEVAEQALAPKQLCFLVSAGASLWGGPEEAPPPAEPKSWVHLGHQGHGAGGAKAHHAGQVRVEAGWMPARWRLRV